MIRCCQESDYLSWPSLRIGHDLTICPQHIIITTTVSTAVEFQKHSQRSSYVHSVSAFTTGASVFDQLWWFLFVNGQTPWNHVWRRAVFSNFITSNMQSTCTAKSGHAKWEVILQDSAAHSIFHRYYHWTGSVIMTAATLFSFHYDSRWRVHPWCASGLSSMLTHYMYICGLMWIRKFTSIL